MSEESTKQGAATITGLVWVSDQISDRDVVRRVGNPATSEASWARTVEVN